MGAQSRYAVAIVASDKTASGINSAEKRFGRLPKTVNEANRASDRFGRSVDQAGRRSDSRLRSLVRTFGAVEQAASKALGGSSLTGGIASRLGAVQEAGAAAGTGLGEAASGATALGGALGGVATAAVATVAIVGAAAYAGYKLADSWSSSAAALGRMSKTLGIANKQLQEWQGAAERAGVDKNAANGAIGSIAETMHDAKYGRNNSALALMNRLGVKFRTKDDGTLDYSAMTLDLADAVARQKDPLTAKRVADTFGGGALLPLLRQGSKAISADMTDLSAHGVVQSDGEIEKATRWQRKKTIAMQLGQKGVAVAGSAAASVTEPILDAFIGGGRAIADGGTALKDTVVRNFRPAVEKLDRAAGTMLEAAQSFVAPRAGATWERSKVIDMARRGQGIRQRIEALGADRNVAVAMAAAAMAESNGNPHQWQILKGGKRGSGYGLFQLEAPRRRDFAKWAGHEVYGTSEEEQIRFALYEMFGKGGGEHASGRKVARADAGFDSAYAFTYYNERPKLKLRDAANRGLVGEEMMRQIEAIPVKVIVEVPTAPPGTKTTVTARGATTVKRHHAMK